MAKADVGRRRATRGRWFVPPPTAEMTSTSAMERGMVGNLQRFWANYNELTTSSLEIMVTKGNHPQIQVSELL